MCEPSTALMAASLALSAVSAGASYDSGRKTANQQADAIKTANDLQALDTAREQSQLAQQGAEQTNDAERRSQAYLATLDAIAGEYGGGASVDRGRAVAGIQASEEMATIASNAKGKLNESSASAFARNVRTSAQLRAIQRPSLAATGLQIGGAALDAYNRFDAVRPQPNKTTKATK